MMITQTKVTVEQQVITFEEKPVFKNTSILVPISQLKPNKLNRDISTSHVKDLARDIFVNGLKFPITINKYGLIIEGHHRVMAYLMLGYKEIEANVQSELKEIDGLRFNNMAEGWIPSDFHKILNPWVFPFHEKYNITAYELELSLGLKKGLLQKESIDPNEYEKYHQLLKFIDSIWITIHNQMGNNANRNIFRSLWRICNRLPTVRHDHLAKAIIREREEISRFTKNIELTKAICKAYNKGLRNGRIAVDEKGNLYIQD